MMGLTELVARVSGREQRQEKIESDRVALDEASLPPFLRVLDELTKLEDLMKQERRTS